MSVSRCPECGALENEQCDPDCSWDSVGRSPRIPSEPSSHKEAAWEDLHMQDISAGPVLPYEAYDHGYRSAMARCADAVQTCRYIAEGGGTAGDPEKYSEYVRTLCRNVIAEIEPPA